MDAFDEAIRRKELDFPYGWPVDGRVVGNPFDEIIMDGCIINMNVYNFTDSVDEPEFTNS
jgi:hypothetical protein